MGEITTFRCTDCGYDYAAIRWGVSVTDPRRRFLPAQCLSCKEYVEVDLTGADLLVDDFFCPTCGAQVFFVERADAYACPKCGGTHVGPHQGPAYW